MKYSAGHLAAILALGGAMVFLQPAPPISAQDAARDSQASEASKDEKKARTLKDTYRLGLAAYAAGNYQQAVDLLSIVSRKRPDNPYAAFFLAKAQQAIREGKGGQESMEQMLAQVTIPEVKFNRATLEEVVEFCRQTTRELSEGIVNPNLVIFDGPEAEPRDAEIINLELRHIPVSEVLRYAADTTNRRVRYESHAVTLRPASTLEEDEKGEEPMEGEDPAAPTGE